MSIPNFIHARRASAAIAPFAIVVFADAANSSDIATATGPTDPLCGTTGKIGAGAAGDMADRTLGGIGSVELGGPVSAGDRLTSDADGKAVATTTAGHVIIGMAEEPGVAGDIIDYRAAPGVIGETV
tara:strand:+ start:1099 stop:1479 length:381 start_codon:yes stop_codon:yes gene_type:complete